MKKKDIEEMDMLELAHHIWSTDYQEIGRGAGKMIRRWSPLEKKLSKMIINANYKTSNVLPTQEKGN